MVPARIFRALKACKSFGWTTAIETTGMEPEEVIKEIVPWLDVVMMDIKHIDQKQRVYW